MKGVSIGLSLVAVFGLILAIFLALRSKTDKNLHTEQNTEQVAKDTKRPLKEDNKSEIKTKAQRPAQTPKRSVIIDAPDLPAVLNEPKTPPINAPQLEDPQPYVRVELYTPDSSVKFAVGDLLTIPEHQQKYIRYLSLYNIPQHERRNVAKIVSFIVNSLSTRRRIYIPHFVGNSDETVIRLNMLDYEWSRDSWEKLAKEGSGPRAQPEPYFHTFKEEPVLEKRKVKKKVTRQVTKTVYEEKQVPKKTWDRYAGRYKTTYEKKRVPKQVTEDVEDEIEVEEEFFSGKRKRTLLVAPWLERESITTLMTKTQSASPIVRADWFIANASVPPAYYNFLKLGNTQADFEKLVLANPDIAQRSRTEDKAVVVTSIVARNNRTLIRSPTFTNGYIWITHDSKTSVNDRQYTQNILDEKFDATEIIATLPNGLQAYFLGDADGNRLDFADPNIAIDNTANDRLVRTGRSCIICHSDGVRPINDEIRSLTRRLQDKNEVKLLVATEEDAYRIDDLFGGDLDEQIIKDQNIYRSAVARSNGLLPYENSVLYARIYNRYVETLLTMEDVCREVGVPMNEIEEYIKLSEDSIILGLLKTPIRAVRRDQWEFCFHRFMTTIMAHKQNLRPIDQVPPGPLIPLEDLEKD